MYLGVVVPHGPTSCRTSVGPSHSLNLVVTFSGTVWQPLVLVVMVISPQSVNLKARDAIFIVLPRGLVIRSPTNVVNSPFCLAYNQYTGIDS